MNKVSPEALAQGITKDSMLRYINSVEPFLKDIKAAYAVSDEDASSLAAAEALIEHNMVF